MALESNREVKVECYVQVIIAPKIGIEYTYASWLNLRIEFFRILSESGRQRGWSKGSSGSQSDHRNLFAQFWLAASIFALGFCILFVHFG